MAISYSVFKIHLVWLNMNYFLGLVTHGACGAFGWYYWHVNVSLIHFLCFALVDFFWMLLNVWKQILTELLVFYVLEKYYISSLLYLLSHISHFRLFRLSMTTFNTRNKDFIWNTQCSIFTLSWLWWVQFILLIG